MDDPDRLDGVPRQSQTTRQRVVDVWLGVGSGWNIGNGRSVSAPPSGRFGGWSRRRIVFLAISAAVVATAALTGLLLVAVERRFAAWGYLETA